MWVNRHESWVISWNMIFGGIFSWCYIFGVLAKAAFSLPWSTPGPHVVSCRVVSVQELEGCAIWGMPVIEVWRSKKVIFCKRSMGGGADFFLDIGGEHCVETLQEKHKLSDTNCVLGHTHFTHGTCAYIRWRGYADLDNPVFYKVRWGVCSFAKSSLWNKINSGIVVD